MCQTDKQTMSYSLFQSLGGDLKFTFQEMASLPTLKSRKLIQGDGENDSGEIYYFSVVTYNILADFHLQQSLSKDSSTYKNCSQEYVKPKQDRSCPRHKLLLTEVKCFLEEPKWSKMESQTEKWELEWDLGQKWGLQPLPPSLSCPYIIYKSLNKASWFSPCWNDFWYKSNSNFSTGDPDIVWPDLCDNVLLSIVLHFKTLHLWSWSQFKAIYSIQTFWGLTSESHR